MNQRNQFRTLATSSATFMSRVYFWMVTGLVMSGFVAWMMASSPVIMTYLLTHRGLWLGLMLAQFAAVMVLSLRAEKMSASMTMCVYLGYAALSGATFSSIFLVFTAASISQAFFIAAFAFVGLSAFGYLTQKDLGPIGSFCIMGLFGMLGLMLVGMLFPSIMTNALSLTINTCCVFIFAGLTAYDTQKIKAYHAYAASPEASNKLAISGALMLYLDFINLFISILRLTGDRR